MSQFISLEEAIAMTTLYREERNAILEPEYKRQNVLCKCETFDRETIDAILAQPGCVSLRIYYGMDPKLDVHAILVGVNEKGQDILPVKGGNDYGDGDGLIGERAMRCPEECPPPSPLNP